MSQEQPEIFEPPLEFLMERTGTAEKSGMYVHSLGHVALSNEVGLGGSSSYYVAYVHGKATIYCKTPEASPEAPDFKAIPAGIKADPDELTDYQRVRFCSGVWVEAIAAGQKLERNFLFAERGTTVTERRRVFNEAVEEANVAVRQRLYEDYGLSNPEQLAA